jgi:hypothetical protein
VIEDLIEQLNVEVTGERQCFYCDAVVPKGWGERELDHFPVPKSVGGTATVVSCYACHHMKDRILFEKWPLEWYGVVLGDLQKFEGDTLPFLARAAQAMFRSMGKDDAMLVSQAEQCGIHLGGWPLDWQSRVIVEFPKMRRETRIFLAKVMRLSCEAAAQMAMPCVGVRLRVVSTATLAAAAATGTLGPALGSSIVATSFVPGTAFLPGFGPRCGTSTVN